LTGCPEMCLTIEPGTRLLEFLNLLAHRVGSDFSKLLLDESGRVDRGILIAIEGRAVPADNYAAYRLNHNCSLAIIPIVAGG